MKLFEQFGLSPDWLKKGSGPMYLRTDQGYVAVDAPPDAMVCEDVNRYGGADAKNSVVPVYSTAAGADGGEELLGRLNIPQSFATPGIHVVRVDSSAMEPVILKDAFVGLDTSKRNVASGELYGVRLPYEGLAVKRVFIDAQNNCLRLRSENPAHPEVALPIEGHEEHVVGRVAWVLQRM